MLEKQLNVLLSKKLTEQGFHVLSELRLHPAEIDIVVLHPDTRQLAAIELKRYGWRKAFQQARRGKLYCHFSWAVLPAQMRDSVPEDCFFSLGLGLAFYHETSATSLSLSVSTHPTISGDINRPFKRSIYRQFYKHFGEIIYA